jgi:hypothetical protein
MGIEFVFLLAFVWGLAVAAFMQFTALGDFLSKRLTWFVTALGCGGDLLLMLMLADAAGMVTWWHIVAIFFCSSIPVAFRGMMELVAYNRREMSDAKDTHR